MSDFVFGAVNIPLSSITVLLNLFGVLCLIIQRGSERLKPPLTILLGSLIGSNLALHVFTFGLALCGLIQVSLSEMFTDISEDVMMYIVDISITSCVWLNVFYYCQIVPAQTPAFIWLKKNNRVFIYSALIMDRVLFLFGFITNIAYIIKERQMGGMQNEGDTSMNFLIKILMADFGLRLAYFLVSLCVMSASSHATVLYLWRHMEGMKDNRSSFSSPKLLSQLRATITGMTQAFLYFLCSVFLIAYKIITLEFPSVHIDVRVVCTVISLYTLMTSLNMGVGQAIFRQRAIHVYQKLFPTTKFLAD
ncbi:taste receptor, type 2, member 201, tandem duplicate 1 [Brachyhypopomus gauderio]|uniref:taste receptor, type 2, member 201, tandem duplicate 1 n=1 Tax=Brachyhypopomus gauderio TaxID=698409 RepID=UPI004042F600